VKPIPVAFHIGPVEIHTYGIGLAITFFVGYRYFSRRLAKRGYPDEWLGRVFIWIVVAAVIGARAVHVIANLGYYSRNPIEIFAIWHGGLSSFGGLALAVPVGFIGARLYCPRLRASVAADIVVPVLVASWALGRLLGPQLMEAGGGKPTGQWFGMYYAQQIGKRLPVPIFQALECFGIFLVLLYIERRLSSRGGPVGVVAWMGVALWGLSRYIDESLWLTHDNGTVAVEVASLAMFGIGSAIAARLVIRDRRRGADRAGSSALPVTNHA
jgi:prolipoprotein diacylglyceryltransferase